ncbi:cytochrome P450 [Actinomadura sp. 9N407]|uniref:cytochrome P450 n=1 Tax=Actinomadura sp. 9N407 TaxID=3375154 RepID=UPI0037AD11EC
MTPREPITLPVNRSCPFDPPDEYARLRAGRPFAEIRLPGGRIGVLVTRYEDARAVLADARFSSSLLQMTPRVELPLSEEDLAVPPGTFSVMDPPEHGRYRRLVARHFTRRRMRELTGLIERNAEERITAMVGGGAPTDLADEFALPLPSMVIGEMLGVPPEDRPRFQRWTSTMLSLDAGPDELRTARQSVYEGMDELVRAKRRRPADDIVSELLDGAGGPGHDEIVNICALLLITGLETTAYMLGFGVYALLAHPDQLAALRGDPALIDGAVEELLRYLTIVQYGMMRTAREDTEINGRPIRAGDTVVVSVAAANRDPAVFADPDVLDVRRANVPHLAFGHGIHQCVGAQLARAELRIGYTALLRRLPGLRLAVPPEDVPMGYDKIFLGVRSLPVAWD